MDVEDIEDSEESYDNKVDKEDLKIVEDIIEDEINDVGIEVDKLES